MQEGNLLHQGRIPHGITKATDAIQEKENIITVEKNFTVYTVFINSEEYFADNIFKPTDSQKELAKNYTESLNLFLNGGI